MKQTPENLLDFERLRSLAELTGGNAYRIVDHFTDTLPDRIREIATVVEQRDASATSALVHQLKGSAANCGFVNLASILGKPRENGVLETAALEKCAWDSIDVWKLFMNRELTKYPDLNKGPAGG